MGFYAPAQIVRDAREHGVEVRPVDINFSDWDCTLEPLANSVVTPAQAGIQGQPIRLSQPWIPAFAGMTDEGRHRRCASGCARSRALPRPMRNGSSRRAARVMPTRTICGAAAGSAAPPWNASPRPTRCARSGLDRRRGLWALKALGEAPLPLFAAIVAEPSRKALAPIGGRGQAEGSFRTASGSPASPRALSRLKGGDGTKSR